MNRATRDMDCKTVHTTRKRVHTDEKLIRMNRKKIDADQKMVRLDGKTGAMSSSAIASDRKSIHMD